MAKKSKETGDEFVFLPLGGCGEIGMNLYLYGYGPEDRREWLMVDLGVRFGDTREPGIDLVFPDVRFIEERRERLHAIILTHAHEDHFGAIIDLWDRLRVPVYATPFSATLLKAKIAESGFDPEIDIREVPLSHRMTLGAFDIEYIGVTHSIPEPNAIALRTPAGNVLHTGDWKVDDRPMIGRPMDEARLKALAEEGCRALVCDSTNVLRDGISPSESDVADGLAEVISEAKNRVAVTTFASNVGRLRAVALAARKADRHLVVAGRAMMRAINAAREVGYLDDITEILPEKEYGYLPPDKVVCLCTGSQGEGRAALARIAEGTHPHITLSKGDMVVFSSKTIPGNEKSVAAVQNSLAAQRVELVTADDRMVHVTGHPRRGELKWMYDILKPELAIPMHGERRHLEEHARFAKKLGVEETVVAMNGEMVRLAPGPAEHIDKVHAGQLVMDGRVIMNIEEDALRERRKLSYVGTVAVAIVLDKGGRVLGDPIVDVYGLPTNDVSGRDLSDVLFDAAEGVLRSLPKGKRRDPDLVEEAVYRAIRREAEQVWGKKPVCQVLVTCV